MGAPCHPRLEEYLNAWLSAAGITFAVAAFVYFVVIPLLGNARAVGDLRYNAAFNLVVCGLILAVTHLAAQGKGVFLLVPAGLGALVLGLFLLGSALAASHHGPSTQGAGGVNEEDWSRSIGVPETLHERSPRAVRILLVPHRTPVFLR